MNFFRFGPQENDVPFRNNNCNGCVNYANTGIKRLPRKLFNPFGVFGCSIAKIAFVLQKKFPHKKNSDSILMYYKT